MTFSATDNNNLLEKEKTRGGERRGEEARRGTETRKGEEGEQEEEVRKGEREEETR